MNTPAREHRITSWLRTANDATFSGYAIIAAFSTYFSMYAFRKPYQAGEFTDQTVDLGFLPPIDFKIFLVISQVVGYMLSKFVGIKVIAEMGGDRNLRRGRLLVGLILVAQLALVGFALTPAPWSAGFLFLNGLPLGMVWGLVFGYLEGRRVSEILGAGLSASYIIASGAVKDIGLWVMDWGVSETMMPAVVGLLFLPVFLVMVWLLSKVPEPTEADIAQRTKRDAMDHKARWAFIRRYALGLFFLTLLYFFLTAYRDFRDVFAIELWKALGHDGEPGILTLSETIIAFGVMIGLALIYRFKDNRAALMAVHIFMASGTALVGLGTLAFELGIISPTVWMVTVGLGLYLAYVPFGCVLFDRLIAAVGIVATAGFMIYVTDAFGYLGSVGLLLYKNFGAPELSWLEFFKGFSYFTSVLCTACFAISMFFFWRRARPTPETGLAG